LNGMVSFQKLQTNTLKKQINQLQFHFYHLTQFHGYWHIFSIAFKFSNVAYLQDIKVIKVFFPLHLFFLFLTKQ
jgi:hypothetical protein